MDMTNKDFYFKDIPINNDDLHSRNIDILDDIASVKSKMNADITLAKDEIRSEYKNDLIEMQDTFVKYLDKIRMTIILLLVIICVFAAFFIITSSFNRYDILLTFSPILIGAIIGSMIYFIQTIDKLAIQLIRLSENLKRRK